MAEQGSFLSAETLGTAASALSIILFGTALILFLSGARKRFGQDREPASPEPFVSREYLRALLLCLGCLVIHTAVVCAIRLLTGKNQQLADTFRLYTGLDSRHYFDIARAGYSRAEETGEILDLVFLPGYPLLTGMLMMVFPEVLSGYLAAWIPFLLAGMALYRLFRLDYGRQKSLRILLWLCLFPGAVFYAYPMSESLFLAAAAMAMYLARTRRWFAAGACGFIAAFTRSPGALLVLPMGIELLEQYAGHMRENRKRLVRDGACLLMVPLALCVYLYINYAVTGNPLVFLQYQKSNWHQQAGWFFRTAGTQAEYAFRTWTEEPVKFWGLWLPNLLVGFASLGLMAARGRKLRLADGAWFFAYFAMCYGTSWLLSGPRYMAVFYPMAVLTEESGLPRWAKGCLLGAGALVYTLCFGMRWSVW